MKYLKSMIMFGHKACSVEAVSAFHNVRLAITCLQKGLVQFPPLQRMLSLLLS